MNTETLARRTAAEDETMRRLYRETATECVPPQGWDYRQLNALQVGLEYVARAAVEFVTDGPLDNLKPATDEIWNWLGEQGAPRRNLYGRAIKVARAVVRGN